ncbi:hypothetical protein ACRAWD_03555 [Caulobacter segnis]
MNGIAGGGATFPALARRRRARGARPAGAASAGAWRCGPRAPRPASTSARPPARTFPARSVISSVPALASQRDRRFRALPPGPLGPRRRAALLRNIVLTRT